MVQNKKIPNFRKEGFMNNIKIKLDRLHYLLDIKEKFLIQVLNITENQEMFFRQLKGKQKEEFLMQSLEEKHSIIKEVNEIDNEFLIIFNSFNGKLNEYIKYFEEPILLMKRKIEKITDIDVKIRIKEEKNNILFLSSKPENKINIPKASKKYILNKYKENSRKM